MTKIYLICGFLGAGKTTFATQLAKEKNAVHLNPDEWCLKLFSKEEYEENWDRCFDKTLDILWDKIAEYARANKSVVFDMGFWPKQSRMEAKRKAEHLGIEAVLYYIYTSDAVSKERISKRSGAIAEYNLKHFDEVKKRFEEPNFY